MTKVSRIKLPKNEMSLLIDQLWRAVALLDNKDEVHKFLHDILTRTEIQMLAKRLEIVKMLREGYTYDLIKKRLRVTDSTIAKINNWYDAFGDGYRLVLERLHQERKAKFFHSRSKVSPSSRRAAVL